MTNLHRAQYSARVALKVGLGLAAFLAGLDKFFNLLADWPGYLSPLARAVLPVSPSVFMYFAGIVEMVVGAAILTRWTRLSSYVLMAWLVAIAVNLVTTGRFFDVAVRDVEMAIAAYALARLTELHEVAAAGQYEPAVVRTASRPPRARATG
jgi:uncharacterized membrane protein YphA (DoxX/SURF4 family)